MIANYRDGFVWNVMRWSPHLNVNGQRRQFKGYTTDIITDQAVDWLKQHRKSGDAKPFFLYVAHKVTHAEFQPAKRHLGRYAAEPVPKPATMANTEVNYWGKPAWVRAQRGSWHGVDYMYHGAMEFDQFYRAYTETVLALDDGVGRVLDYLDQSGLSRNTLVVYMSDNGFVLGEHGLIDKRHAYEESIRVPMLIYAPGMVAPGTTIETMVRNIDIAPTLLELAGARARHPIDGRSVLPAAGKRLPTEIDMGGNVWEWTADWFRPYAERTTRYAPTAASERVQRGGSFLCNPEFCHGYRVSARSHSTPESALFHIGFRLVKDVGGSLPASY